MGVTNRRPSSDSELISRMEMREPYQTVSRFISILGILRTDLWNQGKEVTNMAQRINQTRPNVEEVRSSTSMRVLFTYLHCGLLPSRGLFQVSSTLEGTETTAKGRDRL